MLIENYDNYELSEEGIVTNIKTGRILKPDISWDGYERITLCKDGVTKRFRTNRLVAHHYIPNPNNLEIVNHLDSNRRNNHYLNLEWTTHVGNRQHGKILKGSEIKWSKLNEDQVHLICSLISQGLTRGRIINQVESLTKCQFDTIRSRKAWRHISCNYEWT